MNLCVFMGRLTAEPELKTTSNGISVTHFSLAVDRKYSKDNPVTDFFDIIAWRERAEFVEKYLHKGQRVLIVGEMQTRSYIGRDGIKRKVSELSADQIYFADSKRNAAEQMSPMPNDYDTYQF